MAKHFEDIKGLTEELAARLETRGIKNEAQFLDATRTPELRVELAKAIDCDTKTVLEFANRADLARIKGIGPVFADLLEEAGVDTVKELAVRTPANLHTKLVEINHAKKLAHRTPKVEDVRAWIKEAKKLPKLLEY